MQEVVEEELAFWAELGWTSDRWSCGVDLPSVSRLVAGRGELDKAQAAHE